jgi:hypothetical protein
MDRKTKIKLLKDLIKGKVATSALIDSPACLLLIQNGKVFGCTTPEGAIWYDEGKEQEAFEMRLGQQVTHIAEFINY